MEFENQKNRLIDELRHQGISERVLRYKMKKYGLEGRPSS